MAGISPHTYGTKYLDRQGLWSRAVPGPSERMVTWLQCATPAAYGVQYTWAQEALHAAGTGACPALPTCSKGCSHPPLKSVQWSRCNPSPAHTQQHRYSTPARVTCFPHNPAGTAACSSLRCPCLRESSWNLMIYKVLFQSKPFYDFMSKCDNNLTRHYGKVYLAVHCIEDRVRKNCQWDPLLSHEVQKAPPYFLNSFLKGNLGVSGSRLSPRLGQQFTSKWLCAQSILYLSWDFSFVCY